ncbi:golgin subfamily A member 6-like protein 22 [Lates japonicus]|uniref:Golgin subfamily A member 6-like protein 22 n=1 Tax=Lates japonicus TaxID=270547 RepID=A0AAD3RF35_LATJO|nr:golgin subfamily A member 6-like protein 22 [Lates japonicus]
MEEVLSRADWERIQSSINQPEAKVYTRQEVVDSNLRRQFSLAEDKLLKARLIKQYEESQRRKQAKEERLNMLAAEEVELKRQDWQQAIDKANSKRFLQNGCVRKFNRALHMTHVQKENEALMEFNQERQRVAEERKRQSEEEMRSRLEEALRQEQEKAHQRQLYNQSVADYQMEQIKEKNQVREKERQQEEEERDRLRYLAELYAQELRNQAEEAAESKKTYLKYRLEDISSRKLLREEEAQKLNTVEKERQCVLSDIDEKLQQRKNFEAEKFRKRQIPIEIATDKLAVAKKEQAATTVQREEAKFTKEVAEQDAKEAKRSQKKQEDGAAMLKSICAHREAKIQEKEQQQKAKQKSSLDWLQAQRESSRLFREEQRHKAQRNRENNIKCQDLNVTSVAKKRSNDEQLKKEDHDAAVKDAERAAEREQQLQQYVQSELHHAAEGLRNVSHLLATSTGRHGYLLDGEENDYFCKNTGKPMPTFATNQTRFMKQYLERNGLQLSMMDMEPTRMPPLSRAAKPNLTAKELVGGRTEGSSCRAKGTKISVPALSTSQTSPSTQH